MARRKRKQFSRPNSGPLRRNLSSPRILNRFVLFCEGEVTEPQYFEALRVFYRIQRLSIVTVGVGSGPKLVAGKAVQHYKDNRRDATRGKASFLDQVWVVFDKDEHNDFESSIKRCQSVGIDAAFSNPCFELWLILHVCEMDMPLTRHQAQRICRERSLSMNGSHKKPNSSLLIDGGNVPLAEERAAKQLQKRVDEGLRYGPPATNVGSLTKQLRSVENPSSQQ